MRRFILTLGTLLIVNHLACQSGRDWGTYVGGSGDDIGCAIATDSTSCVIVAGWTNSTAGVALNGYQNSYGGGSFDAFISKYDAAGILIWSTYLGGNGNDAAYSLATDRYGNIYVTGYTSSSTGISLNAFQPGYGGGSNDAFVAKYSATGTLLWSTYYGGNGEDWGFGIGVDSMGNVLLGGETNSTSNIAFAGFQNTFGGGNYDGFVAKFNNAGNRIWATYFGSTGGVEGVAGITANSLGEVYFCGVTNSTTGISLNGYQISYGGGTTDGFLAKCDSSCNLLWSTYYGGNMTDQASSIVKDLQGNIAIAGSTLSNTNMALFGAYQTNPGGGGDLFLAKFDNGGTRLWGTYYGGPMPEEGGSVSTDRQGNIFLAGETYSPSGLGLNGYRDTLVGTENSVVVKFDGSGNRMCATYYGTQHEEEARCSVDPHGNVYIFGGITSSASGIAWNGYQNSVNGPFDAYLVKFSTCGSTYSGSATGFDLICGGQCNAHATANAGGGVQPYTYSWSTFPVQNTQVAFGLCAGTYSVLIVDGQNDSAIATVSVTEPPPLVGAIVSSTPTLCHGSCDGSSVITASGGVSPINYSWNSVPVQSNDTAIYLCAGSYFGFAIDSNGCIDTVNAIIMEPDSIQIAVSITPETCEQQDGSITLNVNGGTGNFTFLWNLGPITDSIFGLSAGTYSVLVTDSNGCLDSATYFLPSTQSAQAFAGPDDSVYVGQNAQLNGAGGLFYFWTPSNLVSCYTCSTTTTILTSTTTFVLTVTDSLGCSSSDSLIIYVLPSCQLFIPKAFSPNGDLQNDILYVRGDCIASMEFSVFNRWGECVFATTDQSIGWNGIWRGNECESAVYSYFLKAHLYDGTEHHASGNISLIK